MFARSDRVTPCRGGRPSSRTLRLRDLQDRNGPDPASSSPPADCPFSFGFWVWTALVFAWMVVTESGISRFGLESHGREARDPGYRHGPAMELLDEKGTSRTRAVKWRGKISLEELRSSEGGGERIFIRYLLRVGGAAMSSSSVSSIYYHVYLGPPTTTRLVIKLLNLPHTSLRVDRLSRWYRKPGLRSERR